MLTKQQIELVKATVPILREHGVALTSHFYKRMLSHNPELMQVFNMGHQRAGFQQQALAGAVLAYAENIENLPALLGAVAHIANKHVSVGIRRRTLSDRRQAPHRLHQRSPRRCCYSRTY